MDRADESDLETDSLVAAVDDGESDFDDDAMAGPPTQVDSESASRVVARRLVIVSQDVLVVPPEIHAMTDSAESDGGASSGFLDMFARDLDPSEPMRKVPDTEDLAPQHSSRVGASEVDEGSTLDHDSEIAGEAPTPTIPVGSRASKRGFESMDLVNLLEILNFAPPVRTQDESGTHPPGPDRCGPERNSRECRWIWSVRPHPVMR